MRSLVTSPAPASTTVLESKNLADALSVAAGHSDGHSAGMRADGVRPDVVMLHLDLLPAHSEEEGWPAGPKSLSGLPVVLVGEDENDPRAEIGLAAGAQDYIVLDHLTSPGLRRTLANAQTRHRLLQSVVASDAHFRTLADAAPVLIWVTDTTQGCIYFNRAWLDFTGRTMEQELGLGWAEGVHRGDYERTMRTYRDAFAARQPFEMEFRLRRHDGVERWVLNRGAPRFSPDGTFLGYSGSCIDITERRLAEDELRLVNESLEQRVAERTAELMRSNQELDQFAYIASHDLKAPLRAIDHLATWIDEDAGPLLPERSRTHLHKMRGRIQRMEGLLDDLLAYSRAGRHKGEATAVSTRELVERVLETVAVPESFQVTLGAELPTITTLHVPLETVLRNLVSNAIKHHDKPTGQLYVDARRVGAGMIEFVLRDDGPGIDPIYHERIFQMFQTLQPRDQLEGSGIGLAIVKKIVDAMGGSVWVESQLGEGAAFYFTWPENSS